MKDRMANTPAAVGVVMPLSMELPPRLPLMVLFVIVLSMASTPPAPPSAPPTLPLTVLRTRLAPSFRTTPPVPRPPVRLSAIVVSRMSPPCIETPPGVHSPEPWLRRTMLLERVSGPSDGDARRAVSVDGVVVLDDAVRHRCAARRPDAAATLVRAGGVPGHAAVVQRERAAARDAATVPGRLVVEHRDVPEHQLPGARDAAARRAAMAVLVERHRGGR